MSASNNINNISNNNINTSSLSNASVPQFNNNKSGTSSNIKEKLQAASQSGEISIKPKASVDNLARVITEDDIADDEVFLDKISSSNLNFHKLFDLPEETVIEKFICGYLLGKIITQGSLFITHNYVCFFSKLFVKIGKVTKIQIKFTDIIYVRKCKVLKSIPNGIEIITPHKKYTWTSFIHRDNAFDLIDSLWKQIKPNFDEQIGHRLSVISKEVLHDEEDEDQEELTGLLGLNNVCTHQFHIPPKIIPRYSKVYPISTQVFYQLFFTDEAKTFWENFNLCCAFLDFDMTNWVNSDQHCHMERRVKFRTPIPFTKLYSRVTQQQRLSIDEESMIFEISTFSKDVPYSNQFLIEAKWIVTNLDNNRCELVIYNLVIFLKKSPLIKPLIERSAIENSDSWYENMLKETFRIAKNYQNHKKSVSFDPPSSLLSSEQPISPSSSSPSLDRQTPEMTFATSESRGLISMINQRKENAFVSRVTRSLAKCGNCVFISMLLMFLLSLILFVVFIYFSCKYVSLRYSLSVEQSLFEDNQRRISELTESNEFGDSCVFSASNFISFHNTVTSFTDVLQHLQANLQ